MDTTPETVGMVAGLDGGRGGKDASFLHLYDDVNEVFVPRRPTGRRTRGVRATTSAGSRAVRYIGRFEDVSVTEREKPPYEHSA
ncbi:hypothetical protein [Streptomyces niveiscabiei]|uniref:Transposase n=1 Tax=Streptomyces niveiscabiei TaxID=164115 RepID=A0ABW9I1Z4_9ACTN